MFSPFQPVIAQEIFDLRKDYCALSVMAVNVRNNGEAGINSDLKGRLLASPPAWADAHLEAWREAYRQFGAKPQRTPPSADALIQRVRKDGQLPTINPVVDLYNTISVAFAIPIGGEDVAAYASSPTLMQATGGEHFDTVKDGAPFLEPVPAGEVVWMDTQGVTCRRWNLRQGIRTRIDGATTEMWFVLERLEPMPISALLDAGRTLNDGLLALSPGAQSRCFLSDHTGTHTVSLRTE